MPYYVLINRASFDIEVQEDQRPGDPWILVKTNDCAPLWPKAEDNKMLRVKTTDEREITAPFKYDYVQCTLLQLKNKVSRYIHKKNWRHCILKFLSKPLVQFLYCTMHGSKEIYKKSFQTS